MNKRRVKRVNRRGWRRALPMGAVLAVAAGLVLAVSACGSSDNGGSSGDKIVIGASIPISGDLAGFGSFEKWGYQHAVDEVNAAGGIEVDGSKKQVELKLLDDKTDPNTTASNTDRLITQDNVVALLGSCTPPLVNAGAVVADRNRVPMVTPCDPLGAFRSVKDWEYVWDIFFDEANATKTPFDLLDGTGTGDQTNKKVALIHDNGPDGTNFGRLWKEAAAAHGYEIVTDASFPLNATNFSSTVSEAKNSDADIVLSQSTTPQAIAIRKEMASQSYKPKVLSLERGCEPVQCAQALGDLANGIIVTAYWDPSFDFPGAADLRKQFEDETGQSSSQHIADTEAAAAVLLDAIKRAGSTDPGKINDAIANTNLPTVVGTVKFADDHTYTLPSVEAQWQNGQAPIIWPKDQATADFIFPLP
jgi:branched-chain amino acid transport system substrate-binding protein